MTASALPSDLPSGAPYQAHGLANTLAAAGHEVTVFSMSPRPADALYGHILIKRHPRATIWRYALDLRRQDFSGFDVLHCHGDDCFLGLKRRPRHVRTFHGSSLAEARACKQWRHKVRMLALAAGEFASLAVADLCIANSRRTLRYFPGLRHYIPCGVDLETFRPGGPKSEHPSILFVGTLDSRKRGRLLLEVFLKVIRPAIPSAELWIVREPGPVEGEGVRLFGQVDKETLAQFYREAWIFCMPSSYEGFGVPYVEAMASGTPVVATFNEGACEVLANGEYGRLCTTDELASTLLALLESPEQRLSLARAGVEHARQFGWPTVAAKYVGAYRGENPDEK